VVVTADLVVAVAGEKMNHSELPTLSLSLSSTMATASIKKFIAKFSGVKTTHILSSRLASADAGGFDLISLHPYLDPATGRVDLNRPSLFKVRIERLDPTHRGDAAVLFKKTVRCADDICMCAVADPDVEAKALGIDISIREALFEVARRPETAHYRWILLTHPLLRGPVKNAVVLENTAATAESDQVLLVPLTSYTPHQQLA
jgi:hypothetical protein